MVLPPGNALGGSTYALVSGLFAGVVDVKQNVSLMETVEREDTARNLRLMAFLLGVHRLRCNRSCSVHGALYGVLTANSRRYEYLRAFKAANPLSSYLEETSTPPACQLKSCCFDLTVVV